MIKTICICDKCKKEFKNLKSFTYYYGIKDLCNSCYDEIMKIRLKYGKKYTELSNKEREEYEEYFEGNEYKAVNVAIPKGKEVKVDIPDKLKGDK